MLRPVARQPSIKGTMTDTAVPATALRMPPDLAGAANDEIARAVRERWAARVWERDASLWTSDENVAAADR